MRIDHTIKDIARSTRKYNKIFSHTDHCGERSMSSARDVRHSCAQHANTNVMRRDLCDACTYWSAADVRDHYFHVRGDVCAYTYKKVSAKISMRAMCVRDARYRFTAKHNGAVCDQFVWAQSLQEYFFVTIRAHS